MTEDNNSMMLAVTILSNFVVLWQIKSLWQFLLKVDLPPPRTMDQNTIDEKR